MRLLLVGGCLGLGLFLAGSSCTDVTCATAADCPVGQVCGLGSLCVDRQCGLILDDSINIIPDGGLSSNCGAGEYCVEGICQLRSTDYLCEAGPGRCGPNQPDAGQAGGDGGS